MTAPFAPPPSPVVMAVALGGVAFVLAAPYARRDDGIGWIATAIIVAYAVGLWGLLLRAWARALRRWWRDRRDAG